MTTIKQQKNKQIKIHYIKRNNQNENNNYGG